MKSKYKKGDRVILLDFHREDSGNCGPFNHYWVDGMNKLIGQTFIIKTVSWSVDDICYTLNNPGTDWGFNEHWLGPGDLVLPEELFEI